MTHTGEKAYVCPFCQHGFIQGGPIRRHILQVHGMEVPKGKLRPFIEEHSKNGAGAAAAENSEWSEENKKNISSYVFILSLFQKAATPKRQ